MSRSWSGRFWRRYAPAFTEGDSRNGRLDAHAVPAMHSPRHSPIIAMESWTTKTRLSAGFWSCRRILSFDGTGSWCGTRHPTAGRRTMSDANAVTRVVSPTVKVTAIRHELPTQIAPLFSLSFLHRLPPRREPVMVPLQASCAIPELLLHGSRRDHVPDYFRALATDPDPLIRYPGGQFSDGALGGENANGIALLSAAGCGAGHVACGPGLSLRIRSQSGITRSHSLVDSERAEPPHIPGIRRSSLVGNVTLSGSSRLKAVSLARMLRRTRSRGRLHNMMFFCVRGVVV